MDTSGIDQMLGMMRAATAQAAGRTQESASSSGEQVDFAQVLQNSIEQVNQTQQDAANLAANFAGGESTADLQEVMVSLQKANISFQEMVQVRNKLVTAYNDVMNMQV